MSQSNKKILISGCGFSYSGQERKTWVNILRSVGANIVDVGGPAVSNQWIINKTFTKLLEDPTVDIVILQLTSIGKLDVEINDERVEQLVEPDSLRNFTFQGIWPSSHSEEHLSKQLYTQLLYSPQLETEDLFCKIMLLTHWCITHNIKLIILQAYDIPWTNQHVEQLRDIILNLNDTLFSQYKCSPTYQYHDSTNSNAVPCIQYHCELADLISRLIAPDLLDRIHKIQSYYSTKSHSK